MQDIYDYDTISIYIYIYIFIYEKLVKGKVKEKLS